jgi:hypothetical protein
MYSAALTPLLPPHTARLPRIVPESRFKGATPTRAANQGCQLLVREGPKLRQFGQKRPAQDGSHPWYAAQQRGVLTPSRAFLDRLVEVVVGAFKLLLKPSYVRLDTLPNSPGRRTQAVVLGGEHLHDLPTSSENRPEDIRLLLRSGPGSRAYRLGEVGEDMGIDPVGLGQTACRAGEVTCLAGIDHRHGQT